MLSRIPRAWIALPSALALLLLTAIAAAGGRVDWKSRTVKESDTHSWNIEVTMYLDKAPDVAHLPVRFSFTPVVYYERSLVDGAEGPQLRKVPLQNRQPLVESVDVGFLDPSCGRP